MQYRDNTNHGNLKFSNVDRRPNKIAKGFTKHEERRKSLGVVRISNDKHPNFDKKGTHREILNLIVRGTTDSLRGYTFLTKTISIEHPKEKGYFKKVLVLNEQGKRKLQKLK